MPHRALGRRCVARQQGMNPMALSLRDNQNPHRHCRLACTNASVRLRSVTIDGATKALTYACSACGDEWQVEERSRPTFMIERMELRF
jgi:hypothetical protein